MTCCNSAEIQRYSTLFKVFESHYFLNIKLKILCLTIIVRNEAKVYIRSTKKANLFLTILACYYKNY